MLRNLPIGTQTFSILREQNMVYVDKTEHIHRLLTTTRQVFFARPRRFGKSLTLSTIRAIYEGQKQLFEGLWIENNWDWTKRNPIIHIAFNGFDFAETPLEDAIKRQMERIAEDHQYTLKSTTYPNMFEELMRELAKQKGRVVVLIDEYYKPIVDFLDKDKLPIAQANREILSNFYGAIKESDPYIEFLMLTGVSKFTQTSIFSKLNHLTDITLEDDYVNLVGYTQAELLANFSEWLEKAHKKVPNLNEEQFMERVKMWYNGYSWDGVQTLYNPFSIMRFMQKGIFEGNWFTSGTPRFLMGLMREQDSFLYQQLVAPASLVDSYDIENIDIRTLLFQTGYLTIKAIDYENGDFTLDYPNREVEEALDMYILGEISKKPHTMVGTPLIELRHAFRQNNIEKAMTILHSLLKDVPNQLIKGKRENFFHTFIHLTFRYVGFDFESELNTSDGRMDCVLKSKTHIYILEFKYNLSAEAALEQIINNDYAAKFATDGRPIMLIGVNFSSRKRGISAWKMVAAD
jgi:Predicted AAA-ATPase/PD-(D/E)XK nuclease superfamily